MAREYEAELDLYYYRARYYSPRLGRFISSDPLLYIDGPNPYSYVRNNSVNYVDPWGLSSKEVLPDMTIDALNKLLNN
ncbi:MAG: RHS repeat-associated core domain-containing protein [Candidatus Peribacteria bacterium]|nr:MAG: RHS repeat-associated core domain-containing protein [Candidatus Peribacteria bacterium]